MNGNTDILNRKRETIKKKELSGNFKTEKYSTCYF